MLTLQVQKIGRKTKAFKNENAIKIIVHLSTGKGVKYV